MAVENPKTALSKVKSSQGPTQPPEADLAVDNAAHVSTILCRSLQRLTSKRMVTLAYAVDLALVIVCLT